MDNQITRFPNGVTNAALGTIFEDLINTDPTKLHTYYTDFDAFSAADWIVTETQAGATQALGAGDGGWLVLTNSAAANDLNAVQKTPSSFFITPGKKAFFKCRFKINLVNQALAVVGLQIADTTPLDVTDGIYFVKPAGTTAWSFSCRKDATTGAGTLANVIPSTADDTFVEFSWYYDGNDKIAVGLNGQQIAGFPSALSYLPDALLAPSLAVQNNDAVAKIMTVDYIFAATER